MNIEIKNSMLELEKEKISFVILKKSDGYEIDFIPINIDPRQLFLCKCKGDRFLWYCVDDYLIKCKNCNKIYKYNKNEVKSLNQIAFKKILIKKLKMTTYEQYQRDY